jgi:S-adenosylmethionine:tRNA ribosyltransferase-isomerase
MHPKDIPIAGFRYDLPQERIAHYPLAERDGSKLLVYREGKIREDIYRNLGDHLPENSLLIFNDTKVIEARIVFSKPSGGQIEVFCLEPQPEYASITQAMLQTGKVVWKCLIGGASKWKPGQVLSRRIGGKRDDSAEGRDSSNDPDGNGGSAGDADGVHLEARWIGKL